MANGNVNTRTPTGKIPTFDQGDADVLRDKLTMDGGLFYPTSNMEGDESFDYYEQNIRDNLLPACIAKLGRNDLVAVHRIAETLATWAPHDRFWEFVYNRQRERMEYLVETGQLPQRALWIWNEQHKDEARSLDSQFNRLQDIIEQAAGNLEDLKRISALIAGVVLEGDPDNELALDVLKEVAEDTV